MGRLRSPPRLPQNRSTQKKGTIPIVVVHGPKLAASLLVSSALLRDSRALTVAAAAAAAVSLSASSIEVPKKPRPLLAPSGVAGGSRDLIGRFPRSRSFSLEETRCCSTMGDFTVQISNELVDRLLDNDEKSKRKTRKIKPRLPKEPQHPQKATAAKAPATPLVEAPRVASGGAVAAAQPHGDPPRTGGIF
ncbi:hypothetical protein NL676_009567 [Syzygium grande]|nr:hypothetical protein NL676_009567 [Syzygium grande]